MELYLHPPDAWCLNKYMDRCTLSFMFIGLGNDTTRFGSYGVEFLDIQ